jgi:hypothetical protein
LAAAVAALALLSLTPPGHSQDGLGPALPAPAALAMVDGQPVSRQDYLDNLEQRQGAWQAETTLLSAMILAEAAKAGLTPTAAEIEEWYQGLKRTIFGGSEPRYQEWLTSGGHSDATMRAEVKVQVAQFKLRTGGATVPEARLRQYHEKYRSYYDQPERWLYRKIDVPWPQRNGRAVDDQAAYAEAQSQLRSVLAKDPPQPGDFEDLARRIEEDPQAARNGGRIGPQPLDLVPPAILAELTKLADGQILDHPIQLEPALRPGQHPRWVLLQRLAHYDAQPGEFEAVRWRVAVDYLVADHKLQSQKEFFAALLKHHPVEIRDPRFAGLKLSGRWHSPSGWSLAGWLAEE